MNLIKEIKKKKELSGLDNRIVIDILNKIKKKYKSGNNLKEKDKKSIIKEARKELRKITGRFNRKEKERADLLSKNKFQKLLETHVSTKERLEDYPKFKEIISNLRVKSILDIGCGLNPLAIAKLNQIYYACDIKADELKIIKKYFNLNKISGKVFFYDLRYIKENDLPEADLCLVMKLFDVLEKKGHKLAEKIIDSVKANSFLISFSTKTLSGKAMNHPQRGWIERMMQRKGFNFEMFHLKNEIIYLCVKNPNSC